MRRLALLTLLCLTCRAPVNPDEGRFSCQTNKDCGAGWECINQFSGGAFCFKEDSCKAEECNAIDDNCDGRIDESFPAMGDVCQTGQPGPCGEGRNICTDGGVVCVTTYTPVAETCNGIDDDCQNGVDDGFDLTSSNQHCGACNRACGAGSQCVASSCRETNCADGIDNDDGGTADCADPACNSLGCGFDGGFNCGALLIPVDAGAPFDAGLPDAGPSDAGPSDAGPSDAGPDDAGMMDAGESDAGVPDAGPFDAGFTLELACVPREFPCDNGADDDFDGLRDCVDPDCAGRACDGGTCMMGSCR